MTDTLLLGFEVPSGQPVNIPIFHTLVCGQTSFSGKTTLLKALALKAVKLGYKVLVTDTKENAVDFEGFGTKVPVVVRDTLDSLELLHLLESIMHTKLSKYYSTLSELCIGGPNVGAVGMAKSLAEIRDRAKILETKTKNGFIQSAARTIWELLERLINQTKDLEKVETLQLAEGISRMELNELEIQSQQVVIATALEDVLKVYKKKVIVVIDEAFKFIPQQYGSACAYNILRVMTQGAMTGLFVWISTQFLAITDKSAMKACACKILGTQDQTQEFQHTLDLLPGTSLRAVDISNLKVGHFYVKTKEQEGERLVYVQPAWLDEKTAREVAMGRAMVANAPVVMTPELVKTVVEQMEAEGMQRVELRVGGESLGEFPAEDAHAIIQAVEQVRRKLT